MKSHERYTEIDLEYPRNGCPEGSDTQLKLVLFLDNHKLRAHVVKHFMNMIEVENTRIKLMNENDINIAEAISDLEKIGCTFYKLQMAEPPCETNAKPCRKFEKCSGIVSKLEAQYIGIIKKMIEESLRTPRYACFWSKLKQCRMMVLMPNRTLVIKAMILKDDVYNLMTCYGSRGDSYTEMRRTILKKMDYESTGRSLVYCDEMNWDMTDTDAPLEKEKTVKSRKRKPKKKRQSKDWRQYLEQW